MKTYEALFQENQHRIYRMALRVVGDPATAEDVVQEVHIKCWKNRDALEQMGNAGGWLMRVTKNLSIDKLRQRRDASQLDEVEFAMATHDPIPDRQAELQNLVAIIRKLVEDLPEKQRLIFQLREIEGLQYKEISAALEVTVDEVKVNLFRARQKIRAKLQSVESYGLSTTHT